MAQNALQSPAQCLKIPQSTVSTPLKVPQCSQKCVVKRLKMLQIAAMYHLKPIKNGPKSPKMPFKRPYHSLDYHKVPFRPLGNGTKLPKLSSKRRANASKNSMIPFKPALICNKVCPKRILKGLKMPQYTPKYRLHSLPNATKWRCLPHQRPKNAH